MKAPMSIGGELQSVRVSVGVAAVAGVHVNPEELVDRADRAMYVAKRERSAIPRAYDGSMSRVAPAEPTKVLQPAGAE